MWRLGRPPGLATCPFTKPPFPVGLLLPPIELAHLTYFLVTLTEFGFIRNYNTGLGLVGQTRFRLRPLYKDSYIIPLHLSHGGLGKT